MRSIDVKPATRQEIDAVTHEPFPKTAIVFTVAEKEEVLGFIGFYRKNSYLVLFSYICPHVYQELKRYKRAFVLGYRQVMKRLKNQSLPVYSVADPSIDGADRLLKHLGFKPVDGETFVWLG